ncbi:MAG TPA: PQQ-binding-like beta-propeller repeat protein [Candidatus Dormibacteraeota bacterium]|nr:PQQ-binding-like beta-propeller repeat protein [Candidatus Dormibacteraeota bacterium]
MRAPRVAALTAACAVFVAMLATPSVGAARPSQTVRTAASFGSGWTTYHHDNARTGHDASAPAIASPNPSKTWNTPLDSNVYAEPLIWNGMVIAVTENDSVYALDEGTGAVIWHVVAGTSVPTHYCASEINPIGITSTPVIDTSTNIVYAVGLVTGPKYQMFALHLADGSNVTGFPVDLAPTVGTTTGPATLDPTVDEQRGALGLANGRVYVPFGGWLGDCGSYHPWVLSVPTTGGALDHIYEPQDSNQREAGIWAGQGMAIDGSGNVYVATGNGGYGSSTPCNNGNYDHGNGVFKLSPTLAELDFFTPSNWCDLSQQDQDVGSIAPALLTKNIVFQTGKSANVWLLRTSGLGGFGGQQDLNTAIPGCNYGDAMFGGTAYVDPDVYIACNSSSKLMALTVNTGSPPLGFGVHWSSSGFTPGPPIVEGGLVWTLNIGGSSLHAYDLAGNQVVNTALPQGVHHFATPAADGDWIFVPQSTSVTGLDFAPSAGPTCGANPCQMYTVDAFGGVDADAFSPFIPNQPHFGWPAARAGHMAPSGTPGVTPPQAGLVLDAYGGLHPYGSPSLTPSQAPYYPGNDIARDFVWLPGGTGGYELDGYGGIHPFSIGNNPLPPAAWQYPYFPGQDVAKKITLLSDQSGGYVLDAYGGLHPWSVTGKPLPINIAEYGYWPGRNIARDIWLAPASTATSASGYVVDAYGGFHPFWSNGTAQPATITQYPYWNGFDIARALWFLPSATTSAATGYELDGYGGLHPFASSGQALPVPITQYSYWNGQDIAKSLFGA